MFFTLSKILFYVLMPSFWLLVALVYLSVKLKGKQKKISILTLCLYLFFSNGFIVNELMKKWEYEVQAFSVIPKNSMAVLLTGITNYAKEPHDRVYLEKGADRVMHTVLLYKKGLIDNVLITGGPAKYNDKFVIEAQELRSVMLLSGVPDSAIITEDSARNTHENAKFSAVILHQKFPAKNYVLVTSAFHMKRSVACFEKEGIKTIPFPVDFYSAETRFELAKFLPTSQSFYKWEVLIHEVLGYVVYKVMGYC